ncbi:hypothetical protein ACFV07_34550 [Streptomyces anulatus]|uniref:hypothetical protein n=1 Tax=Streptomyces anulatus TaxID=1892 RepID=UPI0036CB81BB
MPGRHDGEVAVQQQRTELAHQLRQLLAVPVELIQPGPRFLVVLPDQLHVVSDPANLLRGDLGYLRQRRPHDHSFYVRAARLPRPAY